MGDLAVSGGEEGMVYTLLGRSLDADGKISNPKKAVWQSGGVFVTPPGWWHSHYNEGRLRAWVLPMQDAGLYTHQRTLDIRFSAEEQRRLQQGVSRGATQELVQKADTIGQNIQDAPPLISGTL